VLSIANRLAGQALGGGVLRKRQEIIAPDVTIELRGQEPSYTWKNLVSDLGNIAARLLYLALVITGYVIVGKCVAYLYYTLIRQ
jgi:hypothetical protein